MTLLEVREQFIKNSGRYDLVTSATTFTNNGADYYIQSGQRMLDQMLEFPKDEGEMSFSLATSAISTTLTNVRSVRGLAVVDTGDDTIKYLTRSSMRALRENFGDEVESLSNVTAGEPTHWALGWLRDNTLNVSGATAVTNQGNSKKLITMPPADKTYTIRLQGLFGSTNLSNDTSVSFWSIQHPEILIWSALYQLEVSYRNFEGSRAILDNINQAVERVDHDVVEQSLVERDVQGDSHRFIRRPIRNRDRFL